MDTVGSIKGTLSQGSTRSGRIQKEALGSFYRCCGAEDILGAHQQIELWCVEGISYVCLEASPVK